MVIRDTQTPNGDDHALLSRALEDLMRAPAPPKEGDDGFRDELRAHAARLRWRRLRPRTAAAGAAAAAVVVSALLVFGDDQPGGPVSLAGDVTGDGRIDVRDAYVIQYRIDHGEPAPQNGDRDGDGAIDAQDVGIILDAAVSLSEDGQ